MSNVSKALNINNNKKKGVIVLLECIYVNRHNSLIFGNLRSFLWEKIIALHSQATTVFIIIIIKKKYLLRN